MAAVDIPPPQDLIPKSYFVPEEPARSGGGVSFINIGTLNSGVSRLEKVNAERGNPKEKPRDSDLYKSSLKADVDELRANTNNLHTYMVRMQEEGYVVYCRFGKEYIPSLHKLTQNYLC